MAFKLIFTLFILVILYSCRHDNHIRTYQLTKTTTLGNASQVKTPKNKLTDFIWEKPDSWIPSSGSSMRLASFDVPYSNGGSAN